MRRTFCRNRHGVRCKRAWLWGLIGAALSGAGSYFGNKAKKGGGGGDPYNSLAYKQLPDYSEAEGARGAWYRALEDWSTQPGYGAIPLNWDEIWDKAKSKIKEYYRGGEGIGRGVEGRVLASLARRNMSESPARERMIMRVGRDEEQALQDLAVDQATQEAALAESGRVNWLNSLMQLAGLKPAFVTTTGTSQAQQPNLLGSALSNLGGAIGQYGYYQSLQGSIPSWGNTYSPSGGAGYSFYASRGLASTPPYDINMTTYAQPR